MTLPKVAIIILNWNGKEDTIECIESLNQITYPNYEVLLVDNGSTDGSLGCFREQYPEIEIIENGENLGFAEGNNIGIRKAIEKKVDYVMLLNNDTIVDTEFLNELVNVAESDKKVGIVGPKIYYYYEPKKINFIGGLINYWLGDWYSIGANEIDNGQFEDVINVDWINGCCFIIRIETLRCTGLLDKRFPMGHEDVDISIRAQQCNYKVIATGKSKIWHKIGMSRNKSKKSKKLQHYFKYFYYTFGTKILLIIKHWQGVKLVTALLYNIIYIPYWIFKYIQKTFSIK